MKRRRDKSWGYTTGLFCCCCCVVLNTQSTVTHIRGRNGWEKIWGWLRSSVDKIAHESSVYRWYIQSKKALINAKRTSNADCWYKIRHHMSDFTGARCMNSSLFSLPLIGYAFAATTDIWPILSSLTHNKILFKHILFLSHLIKSPFSLFPSFHFSLFFIFVRHDYDWWADNATTFGVSGSNPNWPANTLFSGTCTSLGIMKKKGCNVWNLTYLHV